MKKALILVVLLLAVFIGELLIFEDKTPTQNPYVAVTSFSLYTISEHISGGKIEIKKLVPFGVEMHTYMPSAKTMSELSGAELFIFNGLGIEPWVKKEYSNQLDMSKFVKLEEAGEDEHEEDGHHHDSEADPHYWLDIDNMILMTKVITQKFTESFPEHKTLFDTNAKTYISELKNLDKEYVDALKSCKHKEIVVNHNAFGYLGHRYGFSSHSVTGLSPDEQVSAKKMKEITDLVNDEDIQVVFFESFVSPEVAQTIANETGAKAESLQPLANVNKNEETKGYIGLMRDNLQKLKIAMECK